ncbi:complex component RRP43 [Seminavis robusta]|uniref:Ribosomal RNA-processing protein 43 n=1 Tax=Seminavis robusta TaxID=568900 RepID=A0A9N8HF50_9STRA|nr:complex component RRP43 [Seminavis robusta]|eukprot:Sro440_g143420.1 complex component RRP43 (318) ;mRNA; f:22707-23660
MLKAPAQKASSSKSHELGSADVIQEWADATLQTALSLDPNAYIPELFWAHKTRPDGRIFGQARQTTITPGVLQQNALGSALVKLTGGSGTSNTHVLAGVTADIGQPSANQGDLKVTLTPSNNNGPLESWLQRLLLQVMDLEQLGIIPGRAAFGLDVTICILNPNGSIADACLLAAVGALQNTALPPIVVQEGRVYTLDNDAQQKELPESWTSFASQTLNLPVIPLPLSMGVMRIKASKEDDNNNNESKQQWLVDPSGEEEEVCQGAITVVLDGLDMDNILSLDYQGKVSMDHADLALALRMAKGRAQELLPLLQLGS